MTDPAIRAVLFDFGGVLAEEGFYNGLVKLAAEQGLDVKTMPEEGMKAVYDSGFVLGRGSASDFWTLMRERTGLKGNDDSLTEVILDGFVLRDWMMDVVKKLRAEGYITGILSDQTHWLDELDEKYHFSRFFDRIYNSYYLGKGKQDPSLFTDVAADLKIQPAKVLFIDDNAANVSRAQAEGLRAIQYIDREDFNASLKAVLGGK